jgi:hypothetical protein
MYELRNIANRLRKDYFPMKNFISVIAITTSILYSTGAYVKLSNEHTECVTPVAETMTYMQEIKDDPQQKPKTVKYELPDNDTDFKTYMSWRAITNTRSAQYKLQQEAWTDENGLRKVGDDYCIAVGTFYSRTVGERFKITLSSGTEFTAIVGDIKADRCTDSKNMYTPVYNERGKIISANVIEFIVDTSSLPREVRRAGTVGALDGFAGNIKTIEKIKE